MLGERRLSPEFSDEVAELLALGRLPKVDFVRLHALPAYEVEVFPFGLDAALHLVGDVALAACRDRRRLRENLLEFLHLVRLYLHDRNFENHCCSLWI